MDVKETQETKKIEKKGLPIVPLLIAVLVVGGIFVFNMMHESQEGSDPAVNQKEMHGEEDEHGHEDGKSGHDDHGEEGKHEEGIKLSEAEMLEFGIKLAKADAGKLFLYVDLPGEVRPNEDRLAHLVPRVSGVVRKVFKGLGDQVEKGEVMAILDSRELSDTKADFLAALERVALAETNFKREESLWLKKISSEQEYLETKQALAEVKIAKRSAEQKLHALGFSKRYLKDLSNHPEESFTRYELIAPFSGRVIEKHITLGEVLKDDAGAFVIADLSTVWVDLSVYQKDLPFIETGQEVLIEAGKKHSRITGNISYLGPVVGEETRTALARIIISNEEGKWRPGLFINAKVAVDEIESDLVVPKSAIQKINDQIMLFVMTDGELKAKPVTLGRSDENNVEITAGINWGDSYVKEGGFTLRAQLGVGDLDDGHNH